MGERTHVLESVSDDGATLAQQPEHFKNDREVVAAAVKNYGHALR